MLRARFSQLVLACAAASSLLSAALPAGAQGVPTTTVPGATGGSTTAPVTFRCPGVTDVSVGADATALPARPVTSTAPALSPVEMAESPCIVADSGPDIEWSADYVARRMTAVGTWRTKLRTVLTDFDALHRQYVANPRIKDMGMWPARLEETLQLANLLAHQSRQDAVIYYANALRDEYKAGIYDEHPLLAQYGLQARDKLDELTAPREPARLPIRR